MAMATATGARSNQRIAFQAPLAAKWTTRRPPKSNGAVVNESNQATRSLAAAAAAYAATIKVRNRDSGCR